MIQKKKNFALCFLFFCVFFTQKMFSDQRIYDCFLFYNELEILDLRLNELYDHVDHFVLVESRESFRGNAKPLYYQENKDLFAKFSDKIIHVIVDIHPDPHICYWDRQVYQRNQIMKGLEDCKQNDIILISDVDEIPRSLLIPKISQLLDNSNVSRVYCRLDLYHYYLNRYISSQWPGTIGIRYSNLQTTTPEIARESWYENPSPILEGAGWHFSYMGGFSKWIDKIGAISETRLDTLENRKPETYRQKVEELQLVPIDESYPKYVYQNIELWENREFIDSEGGR